MNISNSSHSLRHIPHNNNILRNVNMTLNHQNVTLMLLRILKPKGMANTILCKPPKPVKSNFIPKIFQLRNSFSLFVIFRKILIENFEVLKIKIEERQGRMQKTTCQMTFIVNQLAMNQNSDQCMLKLAMVHYNNIVVICNDTTKAKYFFFNALISGKAIFIDVKNDLIKTTIFYYSSYAFLSWVITLYLNIMQI